jgi:amino acid permease
METGWARLAVYLVSAAIVFFGLKSVGFSEKLALGVIVAFVLIVGVGSIRSWRADGLLLRSGSGNWREVLGLYGIVMYSLNAAFAVPQAVQGLGRDAKRCVAAVVTGAAINALLVAAVTVVAIMVSRPVTEVAVVGIGDATNRAVAIAGALFVVSAMLTTYWSVSLALSDIINQRLKLGARISWLIATAPTLVLLLAGLFGFVEYMQIAGGIVALAVAYITVPMYLRARREGRVGAPGWSLGKLGTWPVLLLFVAAMVAMAAGSLLGLL